MTDDELRGLIKKYMEIRHVKTLEEIRAHTSIGSNTTFFKKWHNFKSFTIEELLSIFNYLKIRSYLMRNSAYSDGRDTTN